MDELTIVMKRVLRSTLRYLVVQNCFYLISAFLLLLGCFLMGQTTLSDKSALSSCLVLLGITVLYQILVAVLAVHVRHHLHRENDAFNLACVSLVLLLDPGLFGIRFFSYSQMAGLIVNGARLVLSAGILVFLIRDGRFPISRRAFASWLVVLGVTFLGGAGMEPTRPGHNLLWLNLLSFAPLVHAWLSRWWNEPESQSDLTEQDGHGASGAPIPVLWGDPRSIYRYYTAAILTGYPFFAGLLQLVCLGGTFQVEMGWGVAAPSILGLAVLLMKFRPGLIHADSGLLTALGMLSLAVSLVATGEGNRGSFDTVLSGLSGTSLVFLANIGFGVWTWRLSGARRFPWYAAFSSVALAGGTDFYTILRNLTEFDILPLVTVTAWSCWWAFRDRGFSEALWAVFMALVLFLRTVPMPTEWVWPALFHGFGVAYLLIVHFYPRKDLRATCVPVALGLLALSFAGAHLPGPNHGPATGVFLLELVGFWIAGVHSVVGGYRVASAWFLGGSMLVRVLQRLSAADLSSWMHLWLGPGVMALSFLFLLVGYRVTRQKEEILRWIDDAEPR